MIMNLRKITVMLLLLWAAALLGYWLGFKHGGESVVPTADPAIVPAEVGDKPAVPGIPSTPPPTMFSVIYGTSENAAKFKRLEQLKEVIKRGADVNAPIGYNRMLREGEDVSALKPTAWPLGVAAQQAQVEMIKLLLANGAKFHGGELANAASSGSQDESLAMVAALIEAGADVNSPAADYGFTALFWASAKRNNNSVKLLLAQPGIQLDAVNIDGDTALIAAVGNGDAEIIDMLLKAGANVSIANKLGETALARAQKRLARQQAELLKQQELLLRLQVRPQ